MSGLGWIKFEPQKEYYNIPIVVSATATAKGGSVTITLMIRLEGPLRPVNVELNSVQAKALGAEMVEAANTIEK